MNPLSQQDLEKLIEQKVAAQVAKRQYLWVETFAGQLVLAVVTAVATAYVTQRIVGGRK